MLTPVQILILLWQWMQKNGRKKAMAAGCLFLSFFLWGCSSQELEQQSLVTAIGVDVGEGDRFALTFGFGTSDEEEKEPFETVSGSLEEAKRIYWEYEQKNMDFNHLKNFYFSGDLLQQENFLDLLQEIQTSAAYSRGTLVHVTKGAAGEEAKKEEQPEEGVPVHRVLNAWLNQEPCEIPVVTSDGRYKGFESWPY